MATATAETKTRQATPTEMAETVEHCVGTFTDVLEDPTAEAAREAGSEGIDDLRGVASGLRGLGLRHDRTRADGLARREEEIKSIALLVRQTVRDLGRSNGRLAEEVGAQAQQLDDLAELDLADDLVTDRLRDVVTSLHKATVDIDRDLTHVASGVEASNARIASLERELEETRQKALTDALTKVHSRAALDERLAQQIGGVANWALLMADIDHFKQVNDSLGHLVGDALLFKIARVLDECAQAYPGDAFVGRYGGEEFAVILVGSSLPRAVQTANTMRCSVAEARYQIRARANAVLNPTISIGVALRRPGDTVAAIIDRADTALYQAKHNGRNRVEAADDAQPEPMHRRTVEGAASYHGHRHR
ncbi:MAG: diguanylate cyclase [Candidatus Brocadiae bacterium]|nr:diguanylate cyclase [Candidatus Brocadiia bacterium]